MGQNRDACELSVLLNLMRQAVAGTSQLNVPSVKTALVRYPINRLPEFVPFLETRNPRFRFLIVDTIREICESAKYVLHFTDFPEGLLAWFLEKAVQDESVDVRARSARVIRYFHSPAAIAALRTLMLDADEFVRMHAVRACADPYYAELMEHIAGRLTDAKWRVREAAVKTLATFGNPGRRQLATRFLATIDRYSSEQIADEMQRAGIIVEMLPDLGSQNGEFPLISGLCTKLVDMGKTSLLTDVLSRETRMNHGGGAAPELEARYDPLRTKAQLLDILLISPTPQLQAIVESLAGRPDDPLSGKARNILKWGLANASSQATHAAAGGQSHA
jgi:HEAT repeats